MNLVGDAARFVLRGFLTHRLAKLGVAVEERVQHVRHKVGRFLAHAIGLGIEIGVNLGGDICCTSTSANQSAPECLLFGVPIEPEDAGLLCVHFQPKNEHREGGHRG